MQKLRHPLALLSILGTSVLFAATAAAQYVGPSTKNAAAPVYKSIADVLADPVDDAPVTLEGFLIKEVGKEKYILSDGKSEVRVDIDRKHFPTTPVDDKTRIQIRGEVEKDFMQSPEIDVDRVTVIK
jgi:uncharacterized protein (TIGR00156 family)